MTPVPVVIAFGYFGFVESHFPSQPQKLTWGQVVKLIVINLEPLGKLSAAFQLMTCWFRTSSVFRSQTKNRCKWAPWCMNPFTCQTSGFVGSPPLNKFSPQLKASSSVNFDQPNWDNPLHGDVGSGKFPSMLFYAAGLIVCFSHFCLHACFHCCCFRIVSRRLMPRPIWAQVLNIGAAETNIGN